MEKEINSLLIKEKKSLYFLLGSSFLMFLLIYILNFDIPFHLSEVIAIIVMILFIIVPISLLNFLYVLHAHRNSSSNQYVIINKRNLTLIIILLILLAFRLGTTWS